ncbi:MAG: hypothetical protein R3D32_14850 [Nitratireductor sp.]
MTLSLIDKSHAGLTEALHSVPAHAEPKKALHLLRSKWNVEKTGAGGLASILAMLRQSAPDHCLLYLAHHDHEASVVARLGIPSITVNDGVFTDTSIWRPMSQSSGGLVHHTAVYNARPERSQRHELAGQIPSLLLIFGGSASADRDDDLERIRSILPQATFANHSIGDGVYKRLEHDVTNRLYNSVSVGLALSDEDGGMPSSNGYLAAGLPIVSTEPMDGRGRYYGFPFVQIVKDDPLAIAAAVNELANRNLDRTRIREAFMQVQDFDRHSVLGALNRAGRALLETETLFNDVTPLVHAMARISKMTDDLVKVQNRIARSDPEASASAKA